MKKLLIIVFLFVGCAGTQLSQSEYVSADFGTYPTNYQELIKNELGSHLIDPYSAVYYFGTPTRYKSGGKYGYAVGVEVNAKNRMGGYAGRHLYRYMIHNNEIWQIDMFQTGLINGMRK